ncbi:hypothetical protein ABIE26_002207 [Pedobacter africanus]|uniref:Uncharacterized protein n=1 Tax=Pedobacter africanus TaxID=151894 RepID=A0ACC6KYH2_9SPHI|nr:hypothetical protein [Pedobacter africanus]MDR6784404.1 hypothetical protein [Pedobacter africanus]
MKAGIPLLLLFATIVACSSVKDQKVKRIMRPEVFKGANLLLIETKHHTNQNIYLLQKEFTKRGYHATVNRQKFMVSTTDSIIEKGTAVYLFNAVVKDSTIELSGKFNLKVVASAFGGAELVYKYDIEYTGSNANLSKKLFALLTDIAKDINGRIIYVNDKEKKRGYVF